MSVQLRARAAGDALAVAIGVTRDRDPRGLLVLGVDDRHVGDVDRPLLLDHTDLHVGATGQRALMALDHVQALDVHAVLARIGADDLAGLALVLAGDDDDVVLGADAHQSTSGARLTIFMNPPSRSSRATGPKMRVPRGLFWASMITAAFSSN